MANIGLGVTIGSHSLRAVKLRRKGEKYVVLGVFADRLDEGTRPVAGRALDARGFRGTPATVGLTGRDVIIRYTQVPPVPEWRLRTLMKFEVEEVGQQSGGDVSADYRTLNLPDPEGIRDEETILVALARNTHLSELTRALDSGGLKLGAGVPNSVALFNAFAANATYTEDETSLLVNVGATNLDIAIQQGGELLFARNATPGGRAFTEAIEHAFSTTERKAEKMKRTKADVTPKGQARYPDPTAEKVANALMGVAGQMASLIQSTLMIARAQTRMPDLKIDRVQLAGGGASLKGLDLYLKQALDVPVERFDPFVLCDTSQLDDEERALIQEAPHEFTVAVGLAQNEVAPEAMGLCVLPQALRRAREFATRGIWAAAAAAVMVIALFFMYKARSDAASDYEDKRTRIEDEISDATRQDGQLRKVLASTQDAEVKHRLLAELVAPGVLLAQVLDEVEENITPYIYIESIELEVKTPTYTFDYFKPKFKRLASGYTRTTRSRYRLKEPRVHLEGRVSHGQDASRVAGAFMDACRVNDRGLAVVTSTPREAAGRRREGRFEIDFSPGIVLKSSVDKGIPVTLRNIRLDDPKDPTYFVGLRSDGVEVRVALEDVNTKQRKKLLEDLQARNAADGG